MMSLIYKDLGLGQIGLYELDYHNPEVFVAIKKEKRKGLLGYDTL